MSADVEHLISVQRDEWAKEDIRTLSGDLAAARALLEKTRMLVRSYVTAYPWQQGTEIEPLRALAAEIAEALGHG